MVVRWESFQTSEGNLKVTKLLKVTDSDISDIR